MAKMNLGLSISHRIWQQYKDLNNLFVIWSTLKVRFKSNKSEKEVVYLAKLEVMSLREGKESVQDFVSRIRRKVKDIETLRGSLSEVQITRYFI
jgi:hypothetical protein